MESRLDGYFELTGLPAETNELIVSCSGLYAVKLSRPFLYRETLRLRKEESARRQHCGKHEDVRHARVSVRRYFTGSMERHSNRQVRVV